jgi:RNA polymerase sigma-70 factor (ECF subfamily)
VKPSLAPSDNELIVQSLRGDTSAFGNLVLRYRKLVIGVAYRVCGDAQMAEDIAQETFVRVWDKLPTYRPTGDLRAWICRIASNLTIDMLRRHKATTDIETAIVEAPDSWPENRVMEQERADAVRSAIEALPTHARLALVMREYEGLSYKEIAQALDIPLGTVKSRLSDARHRLQQRLAHYMES